MKQELELDGLIQSNSHTSNDQDLIPILKNDFHL
jgi:hypothetical protein